MVVITMKHKDMRLSNAESIFHSVEGKRKTIFDIMQDVNLSHQAIKNICLRYVENGVFILNKTSKSNIGRKQYSFSVCENFFTAYIDEYNDYFSIIFINPYSYSLDRLEYIYNKNLSTKENLDNAIKLITTHKDFNFCVQIYINCSEKYASLLPEFVERIDERSFIINNYKNDSDIIVFDFKNEIFISLNGTVRKTTAKIHEILKVFEPDKIYTLEGELVGYIMDALPQITKRKMIEKITNIE